MKNTHVRFKIFFLFFLILSCISIPAFSQNTSPEGRWIKVYKGKDVVIYKLWIVNDTLYGMIEQLTITSGDPNPVCSKCSGKNKNRPFKGLTIIWGLKQDEKGRWVSGKVLDPEKGKIYKCAITVDPDGLHLTLKGFLGIFSGKETWTRVKS